MAPSACIGVHNAPMHFHISHFLTTTLINQLPHISSKRHLYVNHHHFPPVPKPRGRIQTLIKQEMAIGARGSWGINGTSLKNYAFTPGRFQPNRKDTAPEQLDFEALFVREAEKAFARGEKLNVLDIGTGDGTTWRKPILKYGEKFNLSATTLCDCHGIWEGIRPMLKFTNAARVHLHYPAESFDVVLSHYGLHMELRAAFDGIIALLKKGGQAFLSGYGYDVYV